MITEQKIENFLVLAEELNFTHAASRLFITQQALSKQIRELEKEIGLPLFTRTTKSVELTEAGEELRTLFTDTSQKYKEILYRHLHPVMKDFRICCFDDMDLAAQLFEAKHLMDQTYPQLNYEFSTRPLFQDILTALENRQIDLAVIPAGQDFSQKSCHTMLLHHDRAFICFSPTLCADRDHPKLDDLRNVVFFMGSEENLARSILERFCEQSGFKPVYYSGKPLTPSVERMMIEGGAGAGMGGKYSVLNRDPMMKKIEMNTDADIAAVWRSGPDEKVIELFAQILRDILNRPS